MDERRIVVLDGTDGRDPAQTRVGAALGDVLRERGDDVEVFALRNEKIAHCIGCFGCWVETPGVCRAADRGRDAVKAMVDAETVVVVTPVTFGGYSSTLKRIVDRWIPVLLPFFEPHEGEIHHPLRYGRFPRLVVVGVKPDCDPAEAELFRAVAGRNALNFRAPSYAAEVFSGDEADGELRVRLASLLIRRDSKRTSDTVAALVPEPVPSAYGEPGGSGGEALVLVGSPKTKTPSTSAVLGRHLLSRLEARGWHGDVLTVTAAVRNPAWRSEMLTAVDAADLLVLAFPLYIDAVPTLLTRALEAILDDRRGRGPIRGQKLVALVNNGFPEAHQNHPALAICARFASDAGFSWAGGLAMGAGEALSSGIPLTERKGAARPPVGHVIAALDRAAGELADGRPVSPETQALLARTPIPFLPSSFWRRFFAFTGGRSWRRRAAAHGVSGRDMLARPYDP